MEKTVLPPAHTLAHWAYLAIDKHFQKILKHEEDVLKDRDPEALHQMRVGMRRLRSAVTGFAPALDLPKAAQEKKIAQIARILGALRDLDVLKEALQNEYQPVLPHSEQKSLKTVFDYLEQERKVALSEMQSALEHKSYQNLKQAVKKWLKHPNYGELAQLPIRDVLPDLLLPLVSQLLLHPAWLVGVESTAGEFHISNSLSEDTVKELLAAKGDVLHSLRKQAKRSRYQLELFTDFYGPNYGIYLEDFQQIQKALGNIQDTVVLAEFLTNALDSKNKNQLPTLRDKLAQTTYQAWQEWQPLQQKYLLPETRQALHLELLKPISSSS